MGWELPARSCGLEVASWQLQARNVQFGNCRLGFAAWKLHQGRGSEVFAGWELPSRNYGWVLMGRRVAKGELLGGGGVIGRELQDGS